MTQPTKIDEIGRDASEDLAQWLQEVGRRRNGPKEPDEALRVHLEQLAGRKIRTRDDITEYVNEVSDKARKPTRTQQVKNALLGALLVTAILQYYFIDVQLDILAQPTLTVFAPSPELRQRRSGQL